MEENITVRVGGDSSSARSALSELVPILNSLREQMQQTQTTFRDTTPHVSNFGGSILNATQSMWGFFQQALAMTTGISLASFFADAANEVRNLADQMFELNVQTERNAFSWQYLFSSGNGPDKAVSQELMRWSSQFSMQVPFTRQDLMGAITSLAMTGLSDQGVEHYMPTLADLAATAASSDGHPVTLQTAAYAVMEAQMGMPRMLKFRLQINPGDLTKYGLKLSAGEFGRIENPEMLMPALQAYAADRGRAGAASGAAHETWWGTYSSFIDRIQNFGLQAGGTSLSGDVTPGSTFGMLKQYLDDINAWLDAHKDQLRFLGDWISRVGGQGLKDLTAGFEGFASGLQKSGGMDLAKQIGQNVMDWLADPKTAQNMRDIGEALGTKVVPALRDAGTIIQSTAAVFGTFFATIGSSWNSMPKAVRDFLTSGIKNFPQEWTGVTRVIQDAIKVVGDLFAVLGATSFDDLLKRWKKVWEDFLQFLKDSVKGSPFDPDWWKHIPNPFGWGGSSSHSSGQSTPVQGISPATTNNVAQVTNQFFGLPQAQINSAVQASIGQQASDWNSAWRQPGGWNFFTAGAF